MEKIDQQQLKRLRQIVKEIKSTSTKKDGDKKNKNKQSKQKKKKSKQSTKNKEIKPKNDTKQKQKNPDPKNIYADSDPEDKNKQMELQDSDPQAQKLFDDIQINEQKKKQKQIIQKNAQNKQIQKKSENKQFKQNNKQMNQNNSQQNKDNKNPQKLSKIQQRIKKVTFKEQIAVQFDEQKRWNTKIQNQVVGKFKPQEEQILLKSIIKYGIAQGLSFKQFEDMMIHTTSQKRHMNMWTKICSVLPNRSITSCFKFIKRKYNPQNHQGKWSKQQQQELISLIQQYGRKWVRIGREIGRTAQNVRDKYVSMGEQHREQRQTYWKIQQLISLMKSIQDQYNKRFIKSGIQYLLENSQKHNQKEELQRKQRKRISGNFIFHNLNCIKKYLKPKRIKKMDIDNIRWAEISEQLKTKSKQDCRNKWKQIGNLIIQGDPAFTEQQDRILIENIQYQNCENEYEIDFDINNRRSEKENKARWLVLKKFVSGRVVKSIKQIIGQIKKKIRVQQKFNFIQKQNNQLMNLFQKAVLQNQILQQQHS